ncbi:MAG TPA: DUF177 domain-containing protein [Vicinamibacterales bacterium]|nr:DUF177 domain-containing protein [Vicinamibacterales bacterium]
MLLVDLSRLRGPVEHVDRTFQPAAFDPPDEFFRVAAPVELTMAVSKTGSDVFDVTGRVRTRLGLACSRCLEPFEIAVDAPFELRYLPQTQNAGEGEREIADEDLATAYYREGMLDLSDLLKEQFQLALPMKPLCSESCRGLCPECGANLNRAACGHAPRWEDLRLAGLKALLNREREN